MGKKDVLTGKELMWYRLQHDVSGKVRLEQRTVIDDPLIAIEFITTNKRFEDINWDAVDCINDEEQS